jgi:hypothetical protein
VLCYHAGCRILFTIMVNAIMLSVVMLNVVILGVIMLNVVMLSVVAPWKDHTAVAECLK